MNTRRIASFIKLLLVILLVSNGTVSHAQVSADEGKGLFRNYCASCHDKKMKKDMTGPALAGVVERWADYDQADLYAWIRNSQALIAAGHPRAVELSNTWNGAVMTAFPNLTDNEIGSILAYIDDVVNAVPTANVAGVGANVVEEEEKGVSGWLYAGLLAFLGLLALILARVIGNLNVIAAKKEDPTSAVQRKSVLDILTSKGLIGFVLFAFILLGGYTTVNNAVSLGRQQGYAPKQPIEFSHATHAGLHKIDCQYCHDGARRSKHSVIPATSTCMNCHSAINYGSQHGTAEISKIYASIGFNPAENKYFEDYENMPEEEIEKIFKTWMKTSTKENDEKLADATEEFLSDMADDQWTALKESLTNEQKKSFKGAIEWVRIHNLPDHVYFNHAQHVTVGGVECQTCHGKVETMDKVEQMSPLSMGWCINCHRETEVKFNDTYYSAYEDYHKELKSGERLKVTVEDIGGLECQKCHY